MPGPLRLSLGIFPLIPGASFLLPYGITFSSASELTPLTVTGVSTDLCHTFGCGIPNALCSCGYKSFDLSSPLLTDRLAGLSLPSIPGACLLPFGIVSSSTKLTPLTVTGWSIDLYRTFGFDIPVTVHPFIGLIIPQLSGDESVNSSRADNL